MESAVRDLIVTTIALNTKSNLVCFARNGKMIGIGPKLLEQASNQEFIAQD